MRLFICGFSGSGKSTLGRVLAKSNDFQVIDLDEEIHERMGAGHDTLEEYIEEIGIEEFRRDEEDMLRLLHQNFKDAYIITLGGGALETQGVRDFIREVDGKVIYLNVPFDDCYERLKKDGGRPLMKKGREFMQKKYDFRKSIFEELSDLSLSVDQIDKVSTVSDLVSLLK